MSRDATAALDALSELPIDLEPETIEQAAELLDALGRALFPEGPPDPGRLTWPDRAEVDDLSSDGTTRTIEERLRHAEARFRTLVEQIPAVTFMAVLGEGENEVYVSPHVEQMLGYTQEEWLSDPFLWYQSLHVDDREVWNEEFARGCRRGGPFRAECRFIARDGRTVWVLGEARVVKDADGRPQFLQGVAFDITESKRAQQLVLETAVETARMQEELEIARRLQLSLLPAAPGLPGLEMAAAMNAADEVGGDYYDVLEKPDGGWLTIGDVSGHGLNAGLVMLMIQSAVQSITRANEAATPAVVLSHLNEVLFENVSQRLGRDEYATLCLLRYFDDGRLIFAGAHQDILIYRALGGRVERVRTPGTWVGIRQRIDRITVDTEIRLQAGDVLVLYTDGIIESANDVGELFDVGRLSEALVDKHGEPVATIRDDIIRQVRKFSRVQDDDLTLIVARYRPKPLQSDQKNPPED